MKLVICIRHLECICRKWCRGADYSWHVQHLLREFGLGEYSSFAQSPDVEPTDRERFYGLDPFGNYFEFIETKNS